MDSTLDPKTVMPEEKDRVPDAQESEEKAAVKRASKFLGSLSIPQAAGLIGPLGQSYSKLYEEYVDVLAKLIADLPDDFPEEQYQEKLTTILGRIRKYALLSNTMYFNMKRIEETAKQRIVTEGV
jgi:hypothetical protein